MTDNRTCAMCGQDIKHAPLSGRLRSYMRKHNITSARKLGDLYIDALLKEPGIGTATVSEIVRALLDIERSESEIKQ